MRGSLGTRGRHTHTMPILGEFDMRRSALWVVGLIISLPFVARGQDEDLTWEQWEFIRCRSRLTSVQQEKYQTLPAKMRATWLASHCKLNELTNRERHEYNQCEQHLMNAHRSQFFSLDHMERRAWLNSYCTNASLLLASCRSRLSSEQLQEYSAIQSRYQWRWLSTHCSDVKFQPPPRAIDKTAKQRIAVIDLTNEALFSPIQVSSLKDVIRAEVDKLPLEKYEAVDIAVANIPLSQSEDGDQPCDELCRLDMSQRKGTSHAILGTIRPRGDGYVVMLQLYGTRQKQLLAGATTTKSNTIDELVENTRLATGQLLVTLAHTTNPEATVPPPSRTRRYSAHQPVLSEPSGDSTLGVYRTLGHIFFWDGVGALLAGIVFGFYYGWSDASRSAWASGLIAGGACIGIGGIFGLSRINRAKKNKRKYSLFLQPLQRSMALNVTF